MDTSPFPHQEVPVLDLNGVGRTAEGTTILEGLDWVVEQGEHWVVLGPNGSGKSTLLEIAALRLHPSTGTVRVLGQELGRVDVRTLRTRVGYASAALADKFRRSISAADVVMTARHGALEPWWHNYDDADRSRAHFLLDRVSCGNRADHHFGDLSSGERQRVLIARALMVDPDLLLLDEPTAGLDLKGREELIATLSNLVADESIPSIVLVTHHVEEIPPGFTHALLLADGRSISAGSLDEALTTATLSVAYGLRLTLTTEEGRWSVRTAGDDQ